MTLSHTASQAYRSVSLLRDLPLSVLEAALECADWDLADIDTNPTDWSHPQETSAFLRLRREDFDAEFDRRDRLKHHPLAPVLQDRRADLDVIRERVDLVTFLERQTASVFIKAGTQYRTNCPLPDHLDNTPSFVVDPTRQKWFCHGCLRGGDAFTFVQELLNCTFRTAVDLLADDAGVTRPRPVTRGRVRVGSVRVA